MWWKKKVKEPNVETEPEDTSIMIYFDSTDSHYKRAENIWLSLGMANDRMGWVAKIAGYLELYDALDKNNPLPYRPDLYTLPEIPKEKDTIEEEKGTDDAIIT